MIDWKNVSSKQIRELFEERAAILQYEAGLSKEEAERKARREMRQYIYPYIQDIDYV